MAQQTTPLAYGLWFDSNAEEAADFYTVLFPDSAINSTLYYGKEGFDIHKRPEGSVMAVNFRLAGKEFQAINGGPVFRINPSISFFIHCKTSEEADKYWEALIDGGSELMGIDSYDWSERYGWLQDKYGVTWQIFTDASGNYPQMICPAIMFVGDQHGRAEEAMNFYTDIFPGSLISEIHRYPGGGQDPAGTVMHARFLLNGQEFKAMDSGMDHHFQFNEGVSVIVNCNTQEEIDRYWELLLQDGGKESECGWLKDKFGVSWQVVPVQMEQLFLDPDLEKVDRVTKAMLQMKKLDLQKLEDAFEGKR